MNLTGGRLPKQAQNQPGIASPAHQTTAAMALPPDGVPVNSPRSVSMTGVNGWCAEAGPRRRRLGPNGPAMWDLGLQRALPPRNETEDVKQPANGGGGYMTTEKGAANGQDAPGTWPNQAPVALASPAREHVLRTLSPAECIGLLEPGGIGRVGFASAEGIMMLPVNFAVTGKAIVFRTAPDTLLALYADAQVSFEVDRFDAALQEGWSVLVHGRAHKVTE